MIIEIETSQPLSETDVEMLLALIAASGHVETCEQLHTEETR